jgi:hypothetical protein
MGRVPDDQTREEEEQDEEHELEPKDCPRGHGQMRLRTRWANTQSRPGQKGSHAQPVTEWFCSRCGRTAPLE